MFRRGWPICVVGIAGCVMYALVHLEARYVAAFLVLFWCGILFNLRLPQRLSPKVVTVITLIVVTSLLLPMSRLIYVRHTQGLDKINAHALAAAELERLGVHAGDRVARICGGNTPDLGIERVSRVEVAAEVDLQHAAAFWKSPHTSQQDLLQTFARRGIKAVIATSPVLDASNRADWTQLGATQFWVWQPKGL